MHRLFGNKKPCRSISVLIEAWVQAKICAVKTVIFVDESLAVTRYVELECDNKRWHFPGNAENIPTWRKSW
jgi:hypothetical protein